MKRYSADLTLPQLETIFRDLDAHFASEKKKIEVLTLGGVAIILQGFRDRSTYDIDLANVGDAVVFAKTCQDFELEVQIVSLASTVDFNDVERLCLFEGECLKVFSVTPKDLIKLKLERFFKQDPEDIYAIVEKTRLSFEEFLELVREGLSYFVGRPEEYQFNAQVVVEQMYPDKISSFKSAIKL